MTEPSPTQLPPTDPASPRRWPKLAAAGLALAAAGAVVWFVVGREMADQYNRWREAVRAAEDNVPIGYLGLNYRRSYNDRPPQFFEERDGRKLLFAARPGPGAPADYYDVTESAVDLSGLEGGFGRDSIPGIDAPIFETAEGERGRNLRARQPVFGVVLGDGPRAYPRDLLEKIEMVNDRDGGTPFVVVYDRGKGTPLAFRRGDFTFGTTGYTLSKSPLLYDRKTKSLWAVRGSDLVCVNGPRKGETLEPFLPLTAATWGDWLAKHPRGKVVVGNDRQVPIPGE